MIIGAVSTRSRVRWLLIHAFDSWAWLVALAAATATRLSIAQSRVQWGSLMILALTAVLANILFSQLAYFHPARARRGSLEDATAVMALWCCVSPLVLFANYFVLGRPVPTSAAALGLPVALLMMLGGRIGWRVMYRSLQERATPDGGKKRLLVFGAGQGGDQIVRAIKSDPNSGYIPVAVLDDFRTRRLVQGLPTVGTRADIERAARQYDAEALLIAIPSADSKLITELDDLGRRAGLEVRVLPPTSELLGMLRVGDIRELTEADLLGRAEVNVDLAAIAATISGRNVLVTGAGGSIGSELCRQLRRVAPAELHMLDRDESALHALQLSMEGRALLDSPTLIVADIRDEERMDQIFAERRIDVVFHAAALKHLTLLESHPQEAVKTNIVGTANVLRAARRHGVELFVNISTDKAANPTSVLGATKLLAERLTAQVAHATGHRYLSVRFGNVLGSRGSVLPTFKQQIENGGPVTVTDADVTRFFMTIPEAVRLVLQACSIGRPGEIMILDMGEPVKILDVAQRLIRQSGKRIDVQFTGLRAGEKLHEELIASCENGEIREHSRITHTSGKCEIDALELAELNEPGRTVVISMIDKLEALSMSNTVLSNPVALEPARMAAT
jgi:FlaA1/EpsC-like NDP-sugar epimerase